MFENITPLTIKIRGVHSTHQSNEPTQLDTLGWFFVNWWVRLDWTFISSLKLGQVCDDSFFQPIWSNTTYYIYKFILLTLFHF